MHSLFFRIFIFFWIAMALIVGGSIALTVAIAARDYDAADQQRRPQLALRAAETLARSGVGSLRSWLSANKDAIPQRDFYIVDASGHDILGRRLSESAMRHLHFMQHEPLFERPPPPPDPPGDAPPLQTPLPHPPPLLPPPPMTWSLHGAPQILGPDGSVYTILFTPRRPGLFGALGLPGIPVAVLAFALLVSALVSGWLARHFSAPIRRIQEGARSVASEQLDVRVSEGLDGRKDELAVLARDFDAMADRLRATRSARTQLLRDISHELRSPLARMRVALGLARQDPSELGRQLDRLDAEAERLDSLIGQILKLARLQGSDVRFDREPVEIDELIEDVVDDARFEGAAKNCTIDLQGMAAKRLTVVGHRELLRSAIENVLRNAVRYSPAQSQIEVRVTSGEDGVSIAILDRGPGVPIADLQHIFEPFYRVAEARDRASGGEGIGLAITAQVMKAHGGDASARNRESGGLEVTLRFSRRPLIMAHESVR